MVDFPAKIQRKFQNMGKKCLKYRLKIYPRRIAKLNTANSNPREIIAPRKMNTLLHPAGYAVLLQRPWCACAGNRPWTLLYRSVIKVSNLFFVFSSNFQQSHISTVFGYGGIPENIRDFFFLTFDHEKYYFYISQDFSKIQKGGVRRDLRAHSLGSWFFAFSSGSY